MEIQDLAPPKPLIFRLNFDPNSLFFPEPLQNLIFSHFFRLYAKITDFGTLGWNPWEPRWPPKLRIFVPKAHIGPPKMLLEPHLGRQFDFFPILGAPGVDFEGAGGTQWSILGAPAHQFRRYFRHRFWKTWTSIFRTTWGPSGFGVFPQGFLVFHKFCLVFHKGFCHLRTLD